MENSAIQKISSVQIEGNTLIISSGQKIYKWDIAQVSKKLFHASESKRQKFMISPSGYGMHWPELDEDLSLNGLLNGNANILA